MAQEETFTIDQGSDVAIELHLVNKDGSKRNLTAHTFAMKMKKNYNSDSADTTAWNCIVSDATGGIMTASLTNLQTDALNAGKYVYDVEMQYNDSSTPPNTIIERVLEGHMRVSPSVTR